MEIKIKLNDMKYRYDVYQMFNIYFPLDEIKFLDDDEKNVEAIKKLAKAANLNVIAVKAAKHDNTF